MNALITAIISTNLSNEAKAAAIAALLVVDAPAKTAKAGKAPKKAAVVEAAEVCLTKRTRLAFIAAAKAEGVDFLPEAGVNWTTKEVAGYCVEHSYAPAGFRIGAGYAAIV
jgi:hypothetical protein